MSSIIPLLLTISSLLARPTLGQSLPVVIQQQATEAVQASLQGNYTTLLRYTYPHLLDLLGGPQHMLALMKQQAPTDPAQTTQIPIEQPGPIDQAGQELPVLVPYVLTIPGKPKAVRLRAYQLAVSQNRGKHWYFVPTDGLTPVPIRALFPAFNPRLKIPPSSKPVSTNSPTG